MTKSKKTESNSTKDVVFCRYRRVRGHPEKVLDAHDYGYQAWCFPVKKARKQ